MGVINQDFFEIVSQGEHWFELLGCSVPGYEGKVNQDSFGYYADDHCIIVAVADGLGSSPLSQTGSKNAIESVFSVLSDQSTENIWERISCSWRCSLDGPAEDYDTTCKFVCIKDGKLVIGSIGDGWLATNGVEGYTELENDKEFTNLTSSMCSKNMLEKTVLIESDLFGAVNFGLSTDGFSEDLDSNSREAFLDDMGALISDGLSNAFKDVYEALSNWPIESNKDDKTLVLMRMVQ